MADKNRQLLTNYLKRLDDEREARDAPLRAEGAEARAAGIPITHSGMRVGSFVWVRWIEGYAGTRAPLRGVAETGHFTMTPAEHVMVHAEWLVSLGLPPEQFSEALSMMRAGYRSDALPMVQ